jgi:hypothetical protein
MEKKLFESPDWIGLYSHEEIKDRHITQLSKSGCGATAIVNVLLLLDIIKKDDIENINWDVCILRRRDESATIFPYLRSRYNAGCTGQELIDSMNLILKENNLNFIVHGKFFSFREHFHQNHREDLNSIFQFPNRKVIQNHDEKQHLLPFVKEHLQKSNVVIATLNLQIVSNDAWHHQIIYGINENEKNYHVMNPLDYYPESMMENFLATEQMLLVRRIDVLSRLTVPQIIFFEYYYQYYLSSPDGEKRSPITDAELLRLYEDETFLQEPWKSFQIHEQIAEMLHNPNISHLIIPAAYEGGLAIFSKEEFRVDC